MGAYATGEPTLERELVGALRAGTLLLTDRGLTAHLLCSAFAATGADLRWRAKDNAVLPVLERFSEGRCAPRSSPALTSSNGPT